MIRTGSRFDAIAILEAGSPGSAATYNPRCDQVVAQLDADGALVGGVVYREYHVASIQAHFAIMQPGKLSRKAIWAAFHYPFVQLGVNKILARIPTSNAKSIHLAERLGFVREALVPGVYPDASQLILSLSRENCRWIDTSEHTQAAPRA
jgi:RimJ/RimL family protein N-acetyltransferase